MNNIVASSDAPSFEKLSPFETVIPSLSSHFYVFCSKSDESNEIWIGWKWNSANLGADILRFFLSFFLTVIKIQKPLT